jgi:hypothetical protein
MADVIASMQSQIKFLTPVISGIVIGLTSMITNILSKLGAQMKQVGAQAGAQAASLATMFGDGLPTFHFQIVVGFYVVQIIYILTFLVNGIENGTDKVNERFLMGQNITRSIILYSTVALVVMVIFNFIASQIMAATITVG